nr:uncharacterized protein LOC112039194 [Quercus suber]
MGLRVLGVQKSFNLNESELQQSQQIGKESYEQSIMWPNINCPPNIIRMSPYYGLPNMLQVGNSPFQSSMIRQVVGMQPFSYHENTSQDDSPLQKACYDLSNEHPSNSIGSLVQMMQQRLKIQNYTKMAGAISLFMIYRVIRLVQSWKFDS